jgi:alpha-glucosidase
VTRSFSIDQIPVYVPAGAIVPREPPMEYTGQKPIDPLILRVYPLADGQTSTYKVYADGSESEAYKRGVCTWTKVTASQRGDTVAVEIAPVAGSYPGMITERAYQLELPGDWPPASVAVNGVSLSFTGQDTGKPGWLYEGNTLTTIVTTPRNSVHTPVRIEIRRAAGSLASRSELDGFAGSVARLHGAYDTLNALFPLGWSPNVLIDAWQTGDRLNYRPQTAQQEIARFPHVYAESVAAVQDLLDKAGEAKITSGSDVDRQKAEHYRLYLQRAIALLKDGRPE